MLVDAVGLWCEINAAVARGAPALFLDRDGVIVADTRYLGRAEHVRVLDGAAAAIARCNALHIPVVLVTNQSGIARGYYDWDGFCAVQAALTGALAAAGAHLDAVLACAYHGDGRGALRAPDHPWRKPNPGMILEAGARMGLELSRSWIVGDARSDLDAGRAAGLAGGTLLHPQSLGEQSLGEQSLGEQSLGAQPGRESNVVRGGGDFVVETAPDLAAAIAALMAQGRLAHATNR
jgi:D-glycero-D-manno-heptose 1,7-bisphosphate phosphatase